MLPVWTVEVRKLQFSFGRCTGRSTCMRGCARAGNISLGSSQMSLTRTAAASLGAAIVAVVAVSAAFEVATAADRFACQDYAESAVLQYKDMKNVKGCKRADDGRWHGNLNKHKSWCLKASEGLLDSERRARAEYLVKCGKGGKVD